MRNIRYVASKRVPLFNDAAEISRTRRKFKTLQMAADRSLDGITCKSVGGRHFGHSVLRRFSLLSLQHPQKKIRWVPKVLTRFAVERNFVMPWDTGPFAVSALHTTKN
jgi:hypothetical protein